MVNPVVANKIEVMFAVFGALIGGKLGSLHTVAAIDAKESLQKALDSTSDGILLIDKATCGLLGEKLLVGVKKYFAAIVRYPDNWDDGATYAFACQEGQTVDFSQRSRVKWIDKTVNDPKHMAYNIHYAVYGAIDANNTMQAREVTAAFQMLVDRVYLIAPGIDGRLLTINNEGLGGDPAPGVVKHFGAIMSNSSSTMAVACQEGQTIDLNHVIH